MCDLDSSLSMPSLPDAETEAVERRNFSSRTDFALAMPINWNAPW
jgi:hypothetical protein